MRNKIRLDTMTEVNAFVEVATKLSENITISDATGTFKVNGKSLLGLVYASAEFDQLYVECPTDIYEKLERFIEIE